MRNPFKMLPAIIAGGCLSPIAQAGGSVPVTTFEVFGVPVDFILFALTLLGVAIFHHHTLWVSLGGMVTIAAYKVLFTGFKTGSGIAGFANHLSHEWVMLANLLALLMGFAILSRHFEKSRLPVLLPRYLPKGWLGGFVLLVLVFIMSGVLDNIAAALIGGAIAHQIFRAKVHIGYLASIVAVSNAGGAGSVVGDTTTTMMWIAGKSPIEVLHAYVPAVVALVIVGFFGARKQHGYSPMIVHAHERVEVDWPRITIVIFMLVGAIATNVFVNLRLPEMADHFPFIGSALWIVIILSSWLRRHDWEVLPETFKGALFLMGLVICASMMPVEELPSPSALTTFGLGIISSVFDNIPLTALALKQGGYDWGMLAYAVGFGGSMIWFGSSAGVALSNMYPEARSVWTWIREGWQIIVGYVLGFAVLFALLGWNPN